MARAKTIKVAVICGEVMQNRICPISIYRVICTCTVCVCKEGDVACEQNYLPTIAAAAVFFKVASSVSFDASSCFSIRCKFSATMEDWQMSESEALANECLETQQNHRWAHHMSLHKLKRRVQHFIHVIRRNLSFAFDRGSPAPVR